MLLPVALCNHCNHSATPLWPLNLENFHKLEDFVCYYEALQTFYNASAGTFGNHFVSSQLGPCLLHVIFVVSGRGCDRQVQACRYGIVSMLPGSCIVQRCI